MIENAIVIVIDALRYDRVGTHTDSNLTPNIDALAAEGASFSNAFTTINATDSAITSLHTGRHPQGHGILHQGYHIQDDEKRAVESIELLPEILQRNGIKTIKSGRRLGRWHKHGFDIYPGRPKNKDSARGRLVEKWNDLRPKIGKSIMSLSESGFERLSNIYETLSRDSSAIDDCLNNIPLEERFYAHLHLMDTHIPYTPRQELIEQYLGRYEEDIPLRELADRYEEGNWSYRKCNEWADAFGDDVGTAYMNAMYDASVREADEKVGDLVSGLRERGLLDDTMVIVLSDHGESLTEHGIVYDHHGLYDCSIRIPTIVCLPRRAAVERDELVQITDIMPTILDYLDIDHSHTCDGRSLKPLITGEGEWTDRDAILAEEAHTQRKRVIRTNDYKYIWTLDDGAPCRYCGIIHGTTELYDMNTDTAETENVAADRPELTNLLQERAERLRQNLMQAEETAERQITYNDEEQIMDRLEDLGYR